MDMGYTQSEAARILSEEGVMSVHPSTVSMGMIGQLGQMVYPERRMSNHIVKPLKKAIQ